MIPLRVRERYPGTEIERYTSFVGESLKKTKAREFVPSQEEIAALLVRQEMSTTVYCHGGGSCKISINSHTTAGEVTEQFGISLCRMALWVIYTNADITVTVVVLARFVQVVEKLIRGLAMEDSRNMFALFEHNDTIDRAVESRVLVADVLAKFERYVTDYPQSRTICNCKFK